MKPGDLVRVREHLWRPSIGNVAIFSGKVGIALKIETTPAFLGGDEMCVVLIDEEQQSFYLEELEIVDEDD